MNKKLFSLNLALLLSLFLWNATAQVTVVGSSTGNGSYSTLAAAVAAIPLTGQSNNNITVEISASTTESATITIGNGNWATLKIFPTANTLTCSGVSVSLNGAKNVTIDGRVNQTGTPAVGATTSLTLSSTSTTLPVLLFDNDAQSNTIQYCTIKIGALQNTTGGINFGAAASITNGNGLNIINHNFITSSGAIYPFYAINATGNTSFPNIGNQITNNEFTNFLMVNPASGYPVGINITGNATANINDNYTISGNSMYGNVQTYKGGNRVMIQIGGGGNGGSHTITGNYFGGSSAQCGGSKMNKSGTVVSNLTVILFSTSGTGTSLIQNNTIKNINWSTTAGAQNFTNITVSGSGNATISGNIIGDNATSGYGSTASIIHSISGTSTVSLFNGISISTTGDVTCDNNQIGSIKAYNSSTSGTKGISVNGISKSGAGTTTISNNLIGSLTAPSSINDSIVNTTLYGQNVNGITFTGTGSCTVSNNTVANITDKTSVGYLYGINIKGTGATVTVNGNLIHSNEIIGYTGIGANIGISSDYFSTAGTTTISNNIVKFGDDNACHIRGIYDAYGSNIYHNTVYIGGAPTTGAFTSSSLYCGNVSARNYKNNILVNARSNAGTASGEHYAFSTTSSDATGLNLDGNDYFVSGTNGFLGKIGTGTAQNTIPFFTGKDAVSATINPVFANEGGNTPESYVPSSLFLTGVDASVTADYSGVARTASPTMGAHDYRIWNGTAWNTSPTADYNAKIDGTFSGAGFAARNLVINAGKQLSITSTTLAVGNNFTILSDATNGTGTFWDNGGTLTVGGSATVQQYLTGGRNWYVSSPVMAETGTNVINSSTATTKPSSMVWYNETMGSGDFANPTLTPWRNETSTLAPTRGYIATSDISTPSTNGIIAFNGALNTGSITTGVNSVPVLTRTTGQTKEGFNLVGNPYPSYVNWNAATKSNLNGTIWYRTNVGGAYKYYTYNAGDGGRNFTDNVAVPSSVTNWIPPMQAFWVRVEGGANGSLGFTNAMRGHKDIIGNVFKAPAATKSVNQLLRLQLSNGTNDDETVVYFNPNAANNLDSYDSQKMMNNSTLVPDLYTKAGTEKLVINGLAEVSDNLELPIGFTTGTAGNFTFKATELTNFDSNTRIFLRDKSAENTEVELAPATEYTFSSGITSANESRFSLIFRAPGISTGNANVANENISVFVNNQNQLVINANAGSKYAIYNALGQQIENGATNYKLQTINYKLNSGVYVVKVGNQSKKVIIK